ncbi:unnamed protein product, partial [Rotaria sp. Silwood2]
MFSFVYSHALLAVGYSDQSKAFIVRNSWGEHWGENGYCYIPYEYLTNPNLCFDVWTIRQISTDNFGREHWDVYDMTDYILGGRNNSFNNSFNDDDHVIETFDENDDSYDDDSDSDGRNYGRQNGGFDHPWVPNQGYGGYNYWQNNANDRYREPSR